MLIKKLPIVAACVALLFSCKKDDKTTTPALSLVGEWEYVSMYESTRSTWLAGKDSLITLITWQAAGNMSTLNITENLISSDNHTYDVDYNYYKSTYHDGQLGDSTPISYTYDSPLGTSQSRYKLVSNDSLHMEYTETIGEDYTSSEGEKGYRISWSKDTLVLTYKDYGTNPLTYEGVDYTVTDENLLVKKYIKKR